VGIVCSLPPLHTTLSAVRAFHVLRCRTWLPVVLLSRASSDPPMASICCFVFRRCRNLIGVPFPLYPTTVVFLRAFDVVMGACFHERNWIAKMGNWYTQLPIVGALKDDVKLCNCLFLD
jgi:hypothetical protein